jgi:hypothetical protein
VNVDVGYRDPDEDPEYEDDPHAPTPEDVYLDQLEIDRHRRRWIEQARR